MADKRKIIKIDEALCNGCGICVDGCPEGALKVLDGKARLVGEILCDGLGNCLGKCPLGAITIEERLAENYSEERVIVNIVKAGSNTIKAHLEHLIKHNQKDYLEIALKYLKTNKIKIPKTVSEEGKTSSGCFGRLAENLPKSADSRKNKENYSTQRSALNQWPIQLQLLNVRSPIFKNADLLIAADCVAFASADFHNIARDKTVVIFCPKLDKANDIYIEKLTEIIINNDIQSLTLIHMEVPCCFSLVAIAKTALEKSKRTIPLKTIIISIKGETL
ncbi:MAG: 4Fe-4S binding protein [Candidatus Omnitrophica bacterium]|nr:4Fe-4S binding protein [Candidatus Omnitrophota bacterium]